MLDCFAPLAMTSSYIEKEQARHYAEGRSPNKAIQKRKLKLRNWYKLNSFPLLPLQVAGMFWLN